MWEGGAGGCGLGGPPITLPTFVPSYEVQLGDSLMSMSGCSLSCWKDVVEKACCPGYWGSQCYGTGWGPQPCSSYSSPGLSERQHRLAAWLWLPQGGAGLPRGAGVRG